MFQNDNMLMEEIAVTVDSPALFRRRRSSSQKSADSRRRGRAAARAASPCAMTRAAAKHSSDLLRVLLRTHAPVMGRPAGAAAAGSCRANLP